MESDNLYLFVQRTITILTQLHRWNNHILIEKYDNKDLTISRSENIKDEKRVDEIARLLAGVDITEKTKESAKEMLEMAENLRKGWQYG